MEFVTVVLAVQAVMLVAMAVRTPSMRPALWAPIGARVAAMAAAWLAALVVGETAGVVTGAVAIAVVVLVPFVLSRWLRRFRGRNDHGRALALLRLAGWLGGGREVRAAQLAESIRHAAHRGRVDEVAVLDERWRAEVDSPIRPLLVADALDRPDAIELARASDPADALVAPLAIAVLCRGGRVGEAIDRFGACPDLRRLRHHEGLHHAWASLLGYTGRGPELELVLSGPLAHVRAPLVHRLRAAATQPAPSDLTPAQLGVIDGVAAEARAQARLQPPTSFDRWRPKVTWVALGAIVLGFANQLRIGSLGAVDSALDAGARVTGVPIPEADQWWRCATAMVVHGSWLHLALNALALSVLGPVAEWRLGRVNTALVVAGGGIGAFALQGVWHDGPTVAVGASGGIMALLGALVVTSLSVRRSAQSMAATRELRFWVVFAAFQLVVDQFVANVDRAGHLSGLVLGVAFTAILLRIPRARLAR